ncbi:type II toxin-antitoxin system HicB family antitoxin [Candidatus Gottesmanbacteria bacterium]|nr:type II toxin-antitoxin system HicB family antitoxin [Candidatus Gottesmanbacteria bacterium]
MNYKVILIKGEDRGYVASVPVLAGCHSEGKTVEEALVNIKEAIAAYVAVCKKYGDPLPASDQDIIEAVVTPTPRDDSRSFSFA